MDVARSRFGERLRAIRADKKMNQEQFAAFLGLSRPTVGFYENGERVPDAVTLAGISDKCQVSADFLLGRTDNSDIATAGLDNLIGLSEKAIKFLRKDKENAKVINRLLESNEAERFVELTMGYNEKTAIEAIFDGDQGTHWQLFTLVNPSHKAYFARYIAECLQCVYEAERPDDVLCDLSRYQGKQPILQKAFHELAQEEQEMFREIFVKTEENYNAQKETRQQ